MTLAHFPCPEPCEVRQSRDAQGPNAGGRASHGALGDGVGMLRECGHFVEDSLWCLWRPWPAG